MHLAFVALQALHVLPMSAATVPVGAQTGAPAHLVCHVAYFVEMVVMASG